VVLNDVFDLEIDRRERPERPLPSGRVAPAAAGRLGWRLLVLGVLLGSATVFFVGHFRPGVAAALLAACIVLYDARLKQTPLGPVAMGACRTLNIFLGMNVLDAPLRTDQWLAAGGVGVYVAGVTWFARREASESSRLQLTLSTMVMGLGIAMLAAFPAFSHRAGGAWIHVVAGDGGPMQRTLENWYLLTGLLGLMIVWRCFWAVIEPIPLRVRIAVAQCVLSIVMLDALACYAVRGVAWACVILLFLLPAMFLGRWIETT
jgi:4-hydroxybenzoate polyprenyltransferase